MRAAAAVRRFLRLSELRNAHPPLLQILRKSVGKSQSLTNSKIPVGMQQKISQRITILTQISGGKLGNRPQLELYTSYVFLK